ncbi:MAG: extradiol ring-cleavage dioxygenase [Alphaproteobacteria bacterium]
MGEILGLGVTHQPPLAGDAPRPLSLGLTLKDPGLPEKLRTPEGWPEFMRREWAEDQGASHGRKHRDEIVEALRHARQVLDEFSPDFIVVWGDDQYENFREDVVPAFCVMAYDRVEYQPWKQRSKANAWGESAESVFTLNGHRAGAKYLASGLLNSGFDIAYAYRPLHAPLGHAFSNTCLYLDWDRKGFDYPVVPISVNCYGRRLILQKGYLADMTKVVVEEDLDPPSPSPERCFSLGAHCARILAESPWRVALIASSSWSHAFLTEKHHYLYPDHQADRRLYEALQSGDYNTWRSWTLADIENNGQHEMLNWFCLVGAMAEIGRRADHSTFIQSSVMNSNKVIATFRP